MSEVIHDEVHIQRSGIDDFRHGDAVGGNIVDQWYEVFKIKKPAAFNWQAEVRWVFTEITDPDGNEIKKEYQTVAHMDDWYKNEILVRVPTFAGNTAVAMNWGWIKPNWGPNNLSHRIIIERHSPLEYTMSFRIRVDDNGGTSWNPTEEFYGTWSDWSEDYTVVHPDTGEGVIGGGAQQFPAIRGPGAWDGGG